MGEYGRENVIEWTEIIDIVLNFNELNLLLCLKS